MTDLPDESDDRPVANDPDPLTGPPNPTPARPINLVWGTHGPVPPDAPPPTSGPVPATPGFVVGSPTSGYPPPPAPPSRAGGSKTALVVVVVAVGLVAVLGIGIVIGLAVSGGSSTEAGLPTSPSQVPATTAPPSAPPGQYSMRAIANACDLLDPTPLTKWSSTPTPPTHREDPPSDGYGGALTCSLKYTSTSPLDGVTTDEAGIGVRVEFTSAGEPPGYDRWNGPAQPGWSTGTIPGLGARNHWRGIAVTDPAPAASYIVGAQDSNVSVEVQAAVHRARGDGPLKLDDLSAIAQSQARTVLDRLKQP